MWIPDKPTSGVDRLFSDFAFRASQKAAQRGMVPEISMVVSTRSGLY